MIDDILKSWKLEKLLGDIDRRDLKKLKKFRNNFYDPKNLFNVDKFEVGDIIYTVNKFENKEHNTVTPCKITSPKVITTRNGYKYIVVKLLNVKSKNGKPNAVRLYFLDYNVNINDNTYHMVFTNKEVAYAYSEDYEPKTNEMYKINKKRLNKVLGDV